jgi:putative endopeptidase
MTLMPLMGAGAGDDAKKALDPVNFDTSVSPGEDFALYTSGNWEKNNPIPNEYSRWGAFEELMEKNLNDLRGIMETSAAEKNAAKGSNVQKIGDFFASGMNVEKIEADGIEPLKGEFDKIAAMKTGDDVRDMVARFHKRGMGVLYYFLVMQDKKNSEMNIPWLYQAGIGLPDRDYYFDDTDRAKGIREEYVKHVAKMLELLGDAPDKAKVAAEEIMKLETRLAKVSMTRLELRNPKATYNKMPLAELAKLAPGYDFAAYFKSVGLQNPGEINVAQPEFFKEIGKVVPETSLEVWKHYFRWNLIRRAAPYLNEAFVNENFNFYAAFLSGKKELQPRWKRCLNATSGALGEALGQIYVDKHFPPKAKARALELVLNLKDAFAQRIKNLDWMSDVTKKKALEKLDAFRVKIGYPDKWIDYSKLDISRDSYVMNYIRAEEFDFQRNLDKANKPVDRDEWQMFPQTVNAYYHPLLNEIVFPAAILQPPFFDFKADDAVNYGAIGGVIGHEITHGFDDQGRQYDKEGNMNDWWTKEDEEKFNKRADVLVMQYDAFVVADDVHVNGKLTLGENIADLGGLLIAYDALNAAWEKNPPKKSIDGYTPQQRFFLSWGQVWRSNSRKKALLMRIKTDVHSPEKFRVNGPLSNLEIFYKAFGVKEGDALFRPKNERANIW